MTNSKENIKDDWNYLEKKSVSNLRGTYASL